MIGLLTYDWWLTGLKPLVEEEEGGREDDIALVILLRKYQYSLLPETRMPLLYPNWKVTTDSDCGSGLRMIALVSVIGDAVLVCLPRTCCLYGWCVNGLTRRLKGFRLPEVA